MSKPRILALHGFRTSADIFRAQIALAALKKPFEAAAEVVYINAPHAARGPAYPEVLQNFEPPFYEWWNAVKEGTNEPVSSATSDRSNSRWTCHGMDESLRFLEDYMVQHGPFDGLMGFSQGATVSALAALLQHAGDRFQDVPKIKFCILIAGGVCRDSKYIPLYEQTLEDPDKRIPCPVFAMIGDSDPHKLHCEEIVPCCKRATVFRHPQGHQVPRMPNEQLDILLAMMQGEPEP